MKTFEWKEKWLWKIEKSNVLLGETTFKLFVCLFEFVWIIN